MNKTKTSKRGGARIGAGRPPGRNESPMIYLRLAPEIHAKLARAAAKDGVTTHAWVKSFLTNALAAFVLFAALVSVGCGQLEIDQAKVVAPPERAAEAIQVVADAYHLHSLPTVYWYGKGLTCNYGTGYINQDGECRNGDELNNVITVALPAGMLINELRDDGCAMLTHEMGHAASEQYGEGGCDDHNCHWFHDDCHAATALLEEMGI